MIRVKYLIFLLGVLLGSQAYAQVVIVSNPSAIAQSAAQFCEEMAVASDQKVTLLNQVKEMLEQSKFMKENADKFKKCMKWVKNARAAVELLDKVKKLKDNYVHFYEQVRNCDILSKTERNNLVYNANLIVQESSEVYEEAKTIISEFTGKEDAGLTSFERIQLMEKLGEKIEKLNGKINVIRSYVKTEVEKRREVINLSMSMYNQFCPSQYRINCK